MPIKIRDEHGVIHTLSVWDINGTDWTNDFSGRDGYGSLASYPGWIFDEETQLYSGDLNDINWWKAEISDYNEEFERLIKYTRTGFQTLSELMEFLKEADELGWHWHRDPVKWDDMELFGGHPPHNTTECWSWDEYDVLVGRNANELEIISRVEWNLIHEK